jgi:hypothetical protein
VARHRRPNFAGHRSPERERHLLVTAAAQGLRKAKTPLQLRLLDAIMTKQDLIRKRTI